MTMSDEHPREVIRSALLNAGLPEEAAADCADTICRKFGGEMVYFSLRGWKGAPARKWKTAAERDELIRAERRAGRSLTWLSQQFVLSKTNVWRICRGVDRAG